MFKLYKEYLEFSKLNALIIILTIVTIISEFVSVHLTLLSSCLLIIIPAIEAYFSDSQVRGSESLFSLMIYGLAFVIGIIPMYTNLADAETENNGCWVYSGVVVGKKIKKEYSKGEHTYYELTVKGIKPTKIGERETIHVSRNEYEKTKDSSYVMMARPINWINTNKHLKLGIDTETFKKWENGHFVKNIKNINYHRDSYWSQQLEAEFKNMKKEGFSGFLEKNKGMILIILIFLFEISNILLKGKLDIFIIVTTFVLILVYQWDLHCFYPWLNIAVLVGMNAISFANKAF